MAQIAVGLQASSQHVVAIEGISVPAVALANRSAFIRAAQKGLSGAVVKQAVDVVGYRGLFIRLLGTTSGNLHRLYGRKALSQSQSEAILDTLRVFSRAASVFGNLDRAHAWLDAALPALGGERPIELCDTFEGRKLVQDAILKIEYGEFP